MPQSQKDFRLKIKSEVESFIQSYFALKESYNKKIYEAMLYSLNAGGKRIRPILLLLSYDMYKKEHTEVLPMAVAIEMIHTYSLIHDDLPAMDNDDLRRGKPTSHKVFGDAIAILAGDALLNEAMNIMFKYCLSDICKVKACHLISIAAGAEGMVGGQVVDLLSENKKISLEELTYMHSKKTGELIKAAVVAGAVLAKAPQNDIELLEEYGEKLGLSFQIKDDILDVIGNTKTLGKNIKSDINNSKTTFITEFGLEQCKNKCRKLSEECVVILDKLSIRQDTVRLKDMTMFLLERNY